MNVCERERNKRTKGWTCAARLENKKTKQPTETQKNTTTNTEKKKKKTSVESALEEDREIYCVAIDIRTNIPIIHTTPHICWDV